MIEVRVSGLWTMLQEAADWRGDAPALLAPNREALSYRGLAEQTERVASGLRSAGIRSEDRVAVVLPNGPEMAAAFLAVGVSASCAPLNPNYPLQDFAFYLRDLEAKALLVDETSREPAVAAARSLGIQVFTIRKLARAGEFGLVAPGRESIGDWPGPEHVALLLHTSGTTSRPKLVPLSARNLTASACHVAHSLALTPEDLCLNIMPLFHIHGLVAALLATLRAGAGVVCTDGVYAGSFFDWLADFRPTWYTAVPTMHQMILARAGDHEQVIRQAPLRFIRSSSAALPAPVRAELERVFGAPVVEAYGMTEAAHQIASEGLPPGRHKPGSVGPKSGPDVAVMDEAGALLSPCQTGEVVIRGPNVTTGYAANPAANATAFTDGWLRTGDQGWMDEEGYLFLTGRLKELINRGGEKISPREIDEVLLGHPAVRQALAFAVPHAQLGEEVGAAVELAPGRSADEAELRSWAGQRLASFKVPRVIRIVETIPKGPTGKLQRAGLARELGIEELDDRRLSATSVAPRTPLEERIAAIWRELLPGAPVGVEERFEALGGDSLLAARMLAAVSTAEGVEAPYERFVEEGTIAALAAVIESSGHAAAAPVAVRQPRGERPPLWRVAGHASSWEPVARIRVHDLVSLLALPGMLVVSWLLPPKTWRVIARCVAQVATALALSAKQDASRIGSLMEERIPDCKPGEIRNESKAGFVEGSLQLLRTYRPGGWNPRIEISGLEHLEAALEGKRGVVLWMSRFNAYTLAAKMAFHRAGYSVTHLSHPLHGHAATRFAARFLNPVRTIAEDRYLGRRVVMAPNDPTAAMLALEAELKRNGIVSITAFRASRNPVTVPFLAGRIELAPGAPSLALVSGAVLLPVFPVQDGPDRFLVTIESPIFLGGHGSRRALLEAATREYATRLEPYVLRYPGQWNGWRDS